MTMPTVKKSIEVDVPVRVAYDQWTQFEEWDADITEQAPDKIIAWRSTSGARNEGTVRFVPAGENKTKIELEMHWEPKDVTEWIGDVLGADDARIQGDLG